MQPLTGSIVVYKSNRKTLEDSIRSFLGTSASSKLYILDNSPDDSLKDLCTQARCQYIFNGGNLGFGAAHNLALEIAIPNSTYHLVLNPDVSFGPDVLDRLIGFLEQNTTVGLLIPRVLDFESRVQYMCKRLPSPIDLILRRLNWHVMNRLFYRRLYRYEMRDKNHDQVYEAPSISGCFMLFRVEALKRAGLFDERFFMYMEDVDLSRRVHKHFKTCCYPDVQIFHGHARESYRWNRQFLIHTISAIKYFNKWGWFFDRERDAFNRE